jgi:hypothetical protein
MHAFIRLPSGSIATLYFLPYFPLFFFPFSCTSLCRLCRRLATIPDVLPNSEIWSSKWWGPNWDIEVRAT